MPAFLDPIHLCSSATSAEVVIGMLLPSLPNDCQYPEFIRHSRMSSVQLESVMRYQLIVTNVDQSATCRPRKLKVDP